MPQLDRGYLVSIEGIDGSGKSTLAKNIYEQLTKEQYNVVLTREPGGTKLGQSLRTLTQDRTVTRCPKAEYLLFASDRAQHFVELIMPALKRKKIVISDRLADSSTVYQGYARNLDLTYIDLINKWTMNNIVPDMTIFVDLPVCIAMDRIYKRNTELSYFERKHFLERVRTGFKEIYMNRRDVMTLDGLVPMDMLTSKACTKIESFIRFKSL